MNPLYRAYGLQIFTDAITPLQTIGGISEENVNISPSVDRSVPDGGIHPTRTVIQSVDPDLEFSSWNIDDVIDAIGTIGQCIKGTTPGAPTHTGVEMFLQRLDECDAAPVAGSVHRKISVPPVAGDPNASGGLIVPRSITCEHRGDAIFSFMVVPKAVNGALNMVIEDGQALATIVDNKNRFSLGQVTLAGYELENLKGISIEFGVQLNRESAESEVLSEWISIDQVLSVITLRGIDPQWLENTAASIGSIPVLGKVLAHADTDFYFRKRSDVSGVDWVPDGTAEHIKGTAAGLAVINTVNAPGRAPVETQIQIFTEYDGTNIPIILNTLQQIT